MTSEAVCHICGLSPMPAGKTQCPQCDADLTCFKVLDSLPDEPVGESVGNDAGSKKQVILLVVISLTLGLISVLSVFQFYWLKQIENRIPDRKTSFPDTELNTGLKRFAIDQSKMSTNGTTGTSVATEAKEDSGRQSVPIKPLKKTDIRAVLAENSNAENNNFWIYWATEKDTLWDISQRHYGSGNYYPVLLEHNRHIGIYDVGAGIQIKILKNTAMARDIYKKITEKKGNNLYWYYSVAEGDTMQSVADKFYRTKNMLQKIASLNPDIDLRPGKQIKILLK